MMPAPHGPRRCNLWRWRGHQRHRGRHGRCCRRLCRPRRRFRRLRRLLSPPSAAAIAYAGGGIEISVAGPPPPPHPCQCFSSTTGGFGSLRFRSLPSVCSVGCRFCERPPAATSAPRTLAAGGRFLRLEGPEFGARLIIILTNVFVREWPWPRTYGPGATCTRSRTVPDCCSWPRLQILNRLVQRFAARAAYRPKRSKVTTSVPDERFHPVSARRTDA